MKTQIKKTDDLIIFEMKGKLDFGTHIPLREELSQIITDANSDPLPKKLIFNLENLEFVGSSGISSFVQTLKEFNTHFPTRPKYCHVKTEFRKIIQAFDEAALFEFFDSEDRAIKSIPSDEPEIGHVAPNRTIPEQ